jgi:hypothetical protein
MICENCQVGGYINEEANERLWFYGISDAAEVQALARMWHGKCNSPGCTCQHVLGDVINPSDISTEERREMHVTLSERFRKFLKNV